MKFPFSHPEIISLPIAGQNTKFPVNNIYCVGRNYALHAKEMGEDTRQPPFFFSKPNWTLTTEDVHYPKDTENLQHEVELVLAIGENDTVFGIAAGVDLTRRDLQTRAKKAGRPWFAGKNFVGSSPVSTIVPVNHPLDFSKIELRLHVNGELRQNATCDQMIWSPSEILSQISYDIPIEPGDLIYTGTPEGVGPVNIGDEIVASIEKKVKLSFSII